MRGWSVLILVPMLAACGSRAADPRGMERGETFLTVTATGRAEARPDEARLSLGVQSQGASAAEAARANREKMDKVTATLARLGVQGDDLQTRNLTLQRIDYGPERGAEIGRGLAGAVHEPREEVEVEPSHVVGVVAVPVERDRLPNRML